MLLLERFVLLSFKSFLLLPSGSSFSKIELKTNEVKNEPLGCQLGIIDLFRVVQLQEIQLPVQHYIFIYLAIITFQPNFGKNFLYFIFTSFVCSCLFSWLFNICVIFRRKKKMTSIDMNFMSIAYHENIQCLITQVLTHQPGKIFEVCFHGDIWS